VSALIPSDDAAGQVPGLWPLFGLLIEAPRLPLRLPREDELPALARAARDIVSADGSRLQMQWMYEPSPEMERRLVQRHWRALAHWSPGSWHLPLAVFLDGEPIGVQALTARDCGVGTVTRATRAPRRPPRRELSGRPGTVASAGVAAPPEECPAAETTPRHKYLALCSIHTH
jgi:hypothetical protein